MRLPKLFVLTFIPLLGLACGSDRGHGGRPGQGPSNQNNVKKTITVQEGGSVSDGSNTVVFPAEAVAEDTDVTVRSVAATDYPDLADAESSVLVIEPEGTVLSKPALVTLRVTVGDKVAKVLQHLEVDGEKIWLPTETAEVGTDTIEVPITTLAPLAVVVEEVVIPQPAGINGFVRWGDGSPATDAEVVLYQSDLATNETPTDSEGHFAFEDLAPGEYLLSVFHECQVQEQVTVVAEMTTEVDLVLCPF